MNFPLLLFIISLLDMAAVIMARYYIEKRRGWVMATSLIFFATSAFVYVQLMAFRTTAIINVLTAAASTIVVTFFYFFVFKERITKGQLIGIGVALMGILMLEI